jgi:diaminopimelate epimerase
MPVTDFLALTPPRQQPFARPFIKMQGLRNHFVFLDCRHAPLPSKPDVIRICDVHEGVGAEQVITIEPPRAPGADVFMGIHNTDGTEAQACGNATRCLAWLLFEETGKQDVLIDSLGGALHCRRQGPWQVSVTLGPITTDWNRVPLARAVDTAHLPLASGPLKDGVALSIGNPHAVFFVDRDVDIPAAAPAIARDPLFPESVNVGVARIIDETTLKLAVWERPGMLTEACGTGACVAAYAGRLRGLLKGDDITVHLPGGTLQIRLLEDGRAVMTGPVAFCCAGFV